MRYISNNSLIAFLVHLWFSIKKNIDASVSHYSSLLCTVICLKRVVVLKKSLWVITNILLPKYRLRVIIWSTAELCVKTRVFWWNLYSTIWLISHISIRMTRNVSPFHWTYNWIMHECIRCKQSTSAILSWLGNSSAI